MGSLSDYSEDKFMDHVLGTTGWPSSPATVYLGLHVGDPTDTGLAGTGEVSGNNYGRVAITFGAPSTRQILQSGDCDFPQAQGGGWGTVDYYGIYDASSGGNFLGHGQLTSPLVVSENDTPSVVSGEVDIVVSGGGCSTYLAHAMLNHIFRDTELTAPTIYVALCSAAIVDGDGGGDITELTMTDYLREAHSAWDASSSGASENTGICTFGTLTGTGQTVESFCLADSSGTGTGNVLFYNTSISQAIASGNAARFSDGALDITLD